MRNSCETETAGSGWDARRLFAANSLSIGKKSNAADRLSPVALGPHGVLQRVPKLKTTADCPCWAVRFF
jgi:hypothetical protein